MRFDTLALALLFLTAGCAAKTIAVDYSMPIEVKGDAEIWCDNHGPNIRFQGHVQTEDIPASLIFSNSKKRMPKKTSEEVVTVKVTLGTGAEYEFDEKKNGQGPDGLTGNPHIYFAPGCDKSDAQYLGRCVQGVEESLDWDDILDWDGKATIEPEDNDKCSNSPGPEINLTGELSATHTVQGCFIFQNNKKNPQKVRKDEAQFEIGFKLLEEGETITISKKGVDGGPGGNPHIWFQLDGEDEIYIGRCKDL